MAKKVVNMIVLGPSRVGKTSLLATMYKEFGKLGVGFSFLAKGETANRLGEAYMQLASVMQKEYFTVVHQLLEPSRSFLEHRFEVSFQGAQEFEIAFHDYRGGLLTEATDQEFPELRSRVADSHVIFNVLDAVALMETDEVCSESLNAHQRVFELLAQALKPNEKYLIVFVLVKCETYIKSETKREALLDRFHVRHKAVLNLIDRLNEHGKNVAGVLIPVNTLGCVQFKQLVKTDNSSVPSFEFMRTSREFATKDVDQPLRYALAFAFAHVQVGSSIWTSLIRPGESMVAAVRRRLSGRRAVFATAVQHFCQERQKGYRTYGNADLLG